MAIISRQFVSGFGIRPVFDWIWTVVGFLCSFMAAVLFLEEKIKSTAELVVVVGSIAATTAVFFFAAFHFRGTDVMRVRPTGWIAKAVANDLVSVVAGASRGDSDRAIVGQVFAAVSVFSLFEVARPSFDFGILQIFLRLPVLSSFIAFGVGFPFFGCVGMLVVLSAWNMYYLDSFEKQWGVVRANERDRTGIDGMERRGNGDDDLSGSRSPVGDGGDLNDEARALLGSDYHQEADAEDRF